MPNQPFVMRLHYYLPKGEGVNSLQSGAHHIEYMGSAEKHELLLGGEPAADRTTLESAAIHAKYAGEREGSMGYFGNAADDPKAAQKSILQAQGPVWRVIASVGEQDALAMGGDLTTKEGWERASHPVVHKMIDQLGLDPAKVQWIAAAHRHQTTENNPHIHLLVWEEGEPSRETAKWTDQERRTVRKAWISELYKPERERLGKEKSESRTESRNAVIDLVARRNGQQGFNRELTERLATLGKQLPDRGRLAYAFMPPDVKAQVEDTIRWLWQADPGLKAQHDKYLESAEEMGTFYWHKNPDQTQDSPGRRAALERIRSNAEADLIKRLAGPVLKAARDQARSPAMGRRPQVATGQRLVGALHRIMWRAERDARATAYWLAESQWRAKKAQSDIARNTGQEIAQ